MAARSHDKCAQLLQWVVLLACCVFGFVCALVDPALECCVGSRVRGGDSADQLQLALGCAADAAAGRFGVVQVY